MDISIEGDDGELVDEATFTSIGAAITWLKRAQVEETKTVYPADGDKGISMRIDRMGNTLAFAGHNFKQKDAHVTFNTADKAKRIFDATDSIEQALLVVLLHMDSTTLEEAR